MIYSYAWVFFDAWALAITYTCKKFIERSRKLWLTRVSSPYQCGSLERITTTSIFNKGLRVANNFVILCKIPFPPSSHIPSRILAHLWGDQIVSRAYGARYATTANHRSSPPLLNPGRIEHDCVVVLERTFTDSLMPSRFMIGEPVKQTTALSRYSLVPLVNAIWNDHKCPHREQHDNRKRNKIISLS